MAYGGDLGILEECYVLELPVLRAAEDRDMRQRGLLDHEEDRHAQAGGESEWLEFAEEKKKALDISVENMLRGLPEQDAEIDAESDGESECGDEEKDLFPCLRALLGNRSKYGERKRERVCGCIECCADGIARVIAYADAPQEEQLVYLEQRHRSGEHNRCHRHLCEDEHKCSDRQAQGK